MKDAAELEALMDRRDSMIDNDELADYTPQLNHAGRSSELPGSKMTNLEGALEFAR